MSHGIKHVTEFTARARELGAKVAEAGKKLLEFAGIAEALSGAGIAYLTHEAAEAIEKTGHLADSLGTTTEALLGMQYAAKHAGVGADEFGQAMRHLEKDIGNPTKEVSDALEKIHTSAIALNGQDASKQFDVIAKGIGSLGTQSEKAAVAAALFGRQGVELLEIFDSYEGIDAYVDRVKKLGGAFSNIDAAQVKEANHALEDMHAIFDAVFTKLAVKFAPFITELANDLISLGTDGTSVADAIGNAFVDVARKMLRLVDVIDLAKGGFYALGGVAYKVMSFYERFEAAQVKALTRMAYPDMKEGSLEDQLMKQSVAELTGHAKEFGDLAGRSFAEAAKLTRSAIDGDRSMSWQKAFDGIIAKAHERAADAVNEKANRKTANTAAERKKLGEEIAHGFASVMSKSTKWLDRTARNASATMAVDHGLKHFLAFMKTLPKRALAMGWRPPMDLQTAVHGTFSGEAAGRQSPGLSIAAKQLEESKKQTELWQQLLQQFYGGVVAP